MKISVCMEALFQGKDLAESVRAVSKTGASAFEFWSWGNKDLGAIKSVMTETGMVLSAFCTESASLVDKRQRRAYIEGLKRSLQTADTLGCKNLITQTGNNVGYPYEHQMKTMEEGLSECVPYLEEAGVTLLVEPLNLHIDHAGYFLASSVDAFSLIERVNSPHVKVLFDIYHQQITEGNIINNIVGNIEKIGHFHAAGLPGRAELFSGELNYPEICRAIDAAGYGGYFGLEYFPKNDVMDGLKKVLEILNG